MGICTTNKKRIPPIIKNPTIINEKKEFIISNPSLKVNNPNKPQVNPEGVTKASSNSSTHDHIKPEIYSIEKFGLKVKSKQFLNESLKFIFHFYNFKCKMLPENRIYILKIVFDGKVYPLSFGYGNNPSFIFDETTGKEILFHKMSTSFFEIFIYTHKNETKDVQFFKKMTKGEILAGTQIFSCLKIDLLTLALSPEKHDFVLLDPKRTKVQLGRINYNLSCKQIEDISIKIKSFKINLNNLNYNQIALNLKYENASIIKETEYTSNFHGTPNPKNNCMSYQYTSLNDFFINNNESLLNTKIESKKILSLDFNDDSFDDIDEYDNYSTYEKLKLHGKMSLNDIFSSQITLNLFSVKLKYRSELERIKNNNVNLNYIPKVKRTIPRFSIETTDLGIIRRKLDLIDDYTLIGVVSLNFYKILYDNENKIEQDATKIFHTMTNQKYDDELNKTLSNSKINSVGIEKNLDANIKDENKENNIVQTLMISAYENVNKYYIEDIINYDGESIGTIEMCIEIMKLPLIKQNMFGVLTETGFEINSIFLYDNNNLSNDLPEELLELIKLKEKLEYEISTNIQQLDFDKNLTNTMQNMKSTLQKSIEVQYLYYGYSSEKDIYQGQEVFIDLGLLLFELIDKLGLEHRKKGFEILQLILKRSEIDLGTLSVSWFKTVKKTINSDIYINNINNKDKDIYDYEFRDKILLERRIIEKFFKFHLEALNYSLDNLIKGKNIDNESRNFTNFYLSIAYFLNPTFREELLKQISSSIDLKDVKYLKSLKIMKKNIIISSDDDICNKQQSNFILWDFSFYTKLDASLNKFNIKLLKNDDKNSKYIKNINSIKEQLSEIKYITNGDKNKNDLSCYNSKNSWRNKIKTRNFIFYNYILELFTYILNILNKIDENNNNTKWTKIPGIDKILEIINYDLIIKDAKNYPKQIYEILPIFYSEISITNHFISSMILNTNIFDTHSIFAILNILDYLFNKDYSINNFNKNIFKENIDYKTIHNSFLLIIKTDNSLAIAKYIWFYYKNISLLQTKHVNKVITHIMMPCFFVLFFHWSFQIREIFYYFLIFIINYKLKKLIKPHKQKEIINKEKNANILGLFNLGIFGLNNKSEKEEKEENIANENRNKENTNLYFFGDLLDEKMTIIEQIKQIVEKEKYDLIYNNIINKQKFKNIIDKIPDEYHSNIIVSIIHYNKVLNDFKIWDKINKEKKIEEKNIIYPNKEIMIIKDDTIQYDD